jgi:hypothetical protein
MGVRPASLYLLRKEKSKAWAKARTFLYSVVRSQDTQKKFRSPIECIGMGTLMWVSEGDVTVHSEPLTLDTPQGVKEMAHTNKWQVEKRRGRLWNRV